MQPYFNLPIWKQAPFIRLLVPLVAGILLQWYLGFNSTYIILCLVCFTLTLLLIAFLPVSLKYALRFFQGLILYLVITSAGMLLTQQSDKSKLKNWYGHFVNDSSKLLLKINEPLVPKTNSYKADAIVEAVINKGIAIPVTGKILLYFAKSIDTGIHYGDKIIMDKPLTWIRNSGNPGAFNYERYTAFQQLYHTAYIGPADFVKTGELDKNFFYDFIYHSRSYILNSIRKYIGGNKNEQGIAEALIIGYKEDLDKDLVQAYSNTGVVHIIAISGLHLGLIYAILLWIFTKTGLIKRQKILSVFLILSFLWLFSLLTGASASVLRSAVMFTFILTGKTFFNSTNGYNALAASAFTLLCWNPYLLWDVGFQLSYLAVFGILWLQQPIYKFWYVKNKILQSAWSLMSVTLAAQVFTFPVCIYYFHQFPSLFLFSNFIAVPLSTIILYGEILVILFSAFTRIALLLGKITHWAIFALNVFIQKCNSLPFSVWDKIYANIYSTWVLYIMVIALCAWFLYKTKTGLKTAFIFLALYAGLMIYARIQINHQQKIIIYNVSRQSAMDFIYKDQFYFVGDSLLLQDALPKNFYLKPARISMLLSEARQPFSQLHIRENLYQFGPKSVQLIHKDDTLNPAKPPLKVDILLITKSPDLSIMELASHIQPAVVVFDASNPLWKIAKWRSECERLTLRCHSVPEQGAFVLDF